MSDFRNFVNEQLQDTEFRKKHEADRTMQELIRSLIAARISAGMTQKELAEKSGIRQSSISKIESGSCVPTITTLRTLAQALGKKLSISFQ